VINKVKKAFSSKEGKTILENLISLSALQLIGMLLPLITLPYVLRVVGFENYGVIVLSTSLVAYFQALTDFSFKITATRDVAVFRDRPRKLNIIYSRVLSVKFLFLLFSYIVIFSIVFSVPKFHEHLTIYFLSSLMLLGYAVFPEWFFQGVEKMKYITFLNLGIKIFFTVFVFVLIRKKEDYWIYPLLQSLGYIGAGLIGQYIMLRKYKLRFIFLPLKSIVNTIRNNFPIFINQFVPNLYNNTSVFLLGILTNTTLVGIYNAILVVVNLLVTLLEILSRVFFPFLNRNKEKFSVYAKLALSVSIVLVLGVVIFHRFIFWYLNISYDQAFLVLVILSIGILGYCLYNVFGMNYFIIHRQDKVVMWNTIFSSLTGLVLAYPLITYFGVVGAAINLTLCRWLMGGGLMFRYFRLKRTI
jgi:PST family polysaccharide transporter